MQKKPVASRSLAVLLGVVLALGSLEAYLRLDGAVPLQRNPLRSFHDSDPRLGWRGAPNYAARFVRPDFDVIIESDEEGFRAPAHFVAPMSEARRIAVLGDSFTWGWGVEQGEVFTDRLQRILGPEACIENYGVNAFGTGQELRLLERLLKDRSFDQVVLMFYENDVLDNVDPKGGRRPWFGLEEGRLVANNTTVEREIAGWTRRWERRSAALSLIRYSGNVISARWKAEGRLSADVPDEPPVTAGDTHWRIQELLLAEMNEHCREHEIDLLAVRIPSVTELQAEASGEHLAELTARLGLPLLDLTQPFRDQLEDGLYFRSDGHWTAQGHHLAATLLAGALGQ